MKKVTIANGKKYLEMKWNKEILSEILKWKNKKSYNFFQHFKKVNGWCPDFCISNEISACTFKKLKFYFLDSH